MWKPFLVATLGGVLLLVAAYVVVLLAVYIFLAVCLGITRWMAKESGSANSGDYRGKHVLVTGGSSGIGLEIAREYLQKGARVTVMARSVPRLAEAKASLLESVSSSSDRVQTVSCDISKSEEGVFDAVKEAVKSFGEVDVLVNCAGTSVANSFEQLRTQDFEDMLRINVLGSIYPTRAVLPAMKARRSGRILFVSSQVAQAAIHGYTAYAASKWALRGLAEALQMETKPFNVFVTVCYPPDTDTPGYQHEMLSKPSVTTAISETGAVFSSKDVAKDIVHTAECNYFGVSTGFDGWMLKQLHPGMSPLNNAWEVAQQIVFASPLRLISALYVLYWDVLVSAAVRSEQRAKAVPDSAKVEETKKTDDQKPHDSVQNVLSKEVKDK